MKTVPGTPGEHTVCLVAVLCAGLLVVSGCQTAGSGPDLIRAGASPFSSNHGALGAVTAEQDLAEARRMLQAGENSNAIPRLTDITTRHAGTKVGAEAWYVLGLAYFNINGLNYAEESFKKYLSLAPQGDFAALCREYLAGIASAASKRGADRAALEDRVARYSGVTAPEELAANLELADTYWRDEDFEKASTVYVRILRTWPSLKEDALIKQRMELGPDGRYAVLTPNEVERRQSASEPLTVFNVQSFRSGRYREEQYGYVDEYYNVAGQVANRGEQPLREAEVTVTIYGLTGQVYDTQTVQLGQLKPGEVRAFSVRFSNFDNIENVHRHECTVSYSQ